MTPTPPAPAVKDAESALAAHDAQRAALVQAVEAARREAEEAAEAAEAAKSRGDRVAHTAFRMVDGWVVMERRDLPGHPPVIWLRRDWCADATLRFCRASLAAIVNAECEEALAADRPARAAEQPAAAPQGVGAEGETQRPEEICSSTDAEKAVDQIWQMERVSWGEAIRRFIRNRDRLWIDWHAFALRDFAAKAVAAEREALLAAIGDLVPISVASPQKAATGAGGAYLMQREISNLIRARKD